MPYDIQPLKAPRAAGTLLRLGVFLTENPVTRGPLSRQLLSNLGLAEFRRTRVDDPLPLAHPLFGPRPSTRASEPVPLSKILPGVPERTPRSGFAFETVADFHAAYEGGGVTPSEVASRLLDNLRASERQNPPLRLFISQSPDDFLAQADASTKRWKAGRALGPLDGVPVAIKDELDVANYPTTVGTKFLGKVPAAEDAEAVARLRRAGALLIGKANMHELGLGVTGLNPHHGSARNPYDPLRATGGSSSGPGAATAAGFCPFALGADGGGSIRTPASFCGLVGLKPTFGRISEHGVAPVCWTVAHLGPLAATASDAALGYAAMSGPDPKDPNTLWQPSVNLDGFAVPDLRGVRLGIYPAWFEDADEAVVKAGREMIRGLEGLGAEVIEIEVPDLALLRIAHMITIVTEMATAHLQYFEEYRDEYGLDVRTSLNMAHAFEASDYLHAQRARQRIARTFDDLMKRVDGIVIPTTGCTAPRLPEDGMETGESNLPLLDRIMRFAPAANFTGRPAITFPSGYDALGMPIGFQVMGRPWEEALLLRIARLAEGLVPRQQPKVSFRLLPSGSSS